MCIGRTKHTMFLWMNSIVNSNPLMSTIAIDIISMLLIGDRLWENRPIGADNSIEQYPDYSV